ncbi:hypothetical protein GCM10009000_098380 [Halobacterium noricense]
MKSQRRVRTFGSPSHSELSERVDGLESELEANGPEAVLRRYEISPPSITTETVRNLFRRLCKEGEIPVEGKHEYVNCPAHGGAGLVSELGLSRQLVGRDESPVRRHCS